MNILLSLVACQPNLYTTSSVDPQLDVGEEIQHTSEESHEESIDEDTLEEEIEDPSACPQEEVFPAPHWQVVPPEQVGFNAQKLEQAAMYAAENDSQCLVVVKEVGEQPDASETDDPHQHE